MATLYITEFAVMSLAAMAPQTPPVAEQDVAIGGSSVASNPFNASTRFIMVNCDAACSLAFGSAPVAVTTAHRMAANETRFYGVQPGQEVAVIANS